MGDIQFNFARYDIDQSGLLDMGEIKILLTEVNAGVAPTAEELAWLMKIADKDADSKISEEELLVAVQAWHGYVYMPEYLRDLFTEFDQDHNGQLDVGELQSLLSAVHGRHVPLLEAQGVLEIADVIGDGKIGRYELLGALGAWYVAVGRRPTPAMSLAFLANNRTGGRLARIVDLAMVATFLPTSYFPLAAALGTGYECKMDLRDILIIDGTLWLLLTVLVLMKGHWVELMNHCCTANDGWKLVYKMSWYTLGSELALLSALCIVEGMGMWSVHKEEEYGEAEIAECELGAQLPTDIPLSIKSKQWQPYPSFLEYCNIWFMFNFYFNLVTILAYYSYAAYRFYKVWKADQALQTKEAEEFMPHASQMMDAVGKTRSFSFRMCGCGFSRCLPNSNELDSHRLIALDRCDEY